MSASEIYPYASGDLLENRNVYSYSPYHGAPFLAAWAARRAKAGEDSALGRALSARETPALALIRSVKSGLGGPRSGEAWRTLDRLVQRFEVTKRVHADYTDAWRAVDKTQFDAMPAYVALAEAFGDAYEMSGQLTYLNVLLKILDTLSALMGDLPGDLKARTAALIEREAVFVAKLQDTAAPGEVASPDAVPDMPVPVAAGPKAVLLACESARSRAYLEAMCRFGLAPSEVLIMGPEADRAPVPSPAAESWKGLFVPRFQDRLSDFCQRAGIPVAHLPERDVNAVATLEAVAQVEADLIVYSGVGGQIVSERVLKSGPRFLHMHAGWLPDYRGSTTFYYAMLNNQLPAVSAIFLDPGIDTGAIIGRQSYPMPVRGMNVDLVYDPVIRADLLCRTLSRFASSGTMAADITQTEDEGTTYYEIHPVLKHIALLSLAGEQA